ncbi:MAG: hypothetical protein PHV68_02595 [Candidatus Gastranaerophilales bacterium]|nr:hypothetical protein [Candidatus Gastranaerophilales bacterium]
MKNFKKEEIINHLWNWFSTYKGKEDIKDTSNLRNTKFDCYIESKIPDPLSFSVFELSDKGEALIDNATEVMESEAAFFLFVNTKTGWMFAVKNTPENVKKMIKGEPIQQIKIKIAT